MMGKILVVDDEPDIRDLLKDILDDEGYDVEVAQDGNSARQAFNAFVPDLVLLDIWMPDVDGISLLKEWEIEPESASAVVMMSGHGTVETAMEATKYGAQDFLEKPISMAKLLTTVSNNLKSHSENLTKESKPQQFEQLIGSSTLIKNLRNEVETAVASGHPIFVHGELGVGKHVLASHVAHSVENIKRIEWITPNNFHLPTQHDNNCVFYVSDCAELRVEQMKSLGEFFMQNEFANQQKNLKFVLSTVHEYASFVDKLSSLPFLRDSWRFPIRIPALSQHKEDVPELLEYYVNWISSTEDLPYRHFNVAAQNLLRNHDWKGNLSELKALIRKLLASKNDPDIETNEISSLLQLSALQEKPEPLQSGHVFMIDLDKDLKDSREMFERQYLQLQLDQCAGNMSELARRSGQERTYLYRKIKSLGIQTKK